MTTLQYVDPQLVIALNRKIVFVYPNDLQIFKEVQLPEDLTKCGLEIRSDDQENNGTDGPEKEQRKTAQEPQQQQEPPIIQNVRLSSDGNLLAVTTSGQKALLLYQCYDVHAKLVSVRPLTRASSALAFNSDSTRLLVTDKTGDCYEYSCTDLEAAPTAAPKLLLGHLSIVYDVLWSDDSKYIITCDRDDKIRVTNYPETYDIHGYCLGHREFVAGLAQLDERVIVSVSGDKTMQLWEFESGKQVGLMELPAPAIRLSVRTLVDEKSQKYQVAVLLHQPDECVALYEVAKNDKDSWDITETAVLSFPSMVASNLCFANDRLYVAGTIDERFSLQVADIANATPAPPNWLDMINTQFQNELWKQEDISAWFKKRYDNVSDYLERKKRRIEEKQKQ